MNTLWAGKVLGGAFGAISGGFAGLVIGAYAGHLLDKLLLHWLQGHQDTPIQTASIPKPSSRAARSPEKTVQDIFFAVTFRSLGKIAKADGRVCEAEIAAASSIMNQMSLSKIQRQKAIGYFNDGKAEQYDGLKDWAKLRQTCKNRDDLIQIFLEIQLSMAYADAHLGGHERQLFKQMCHQLEVGAFQFEWINSRVKSSIMGRQSSRKGDRKHTSKETKQANPIHNAYGVMGVAADISDTELKKAYRRLMSEHHPDKLIAKGLPESMMKLAKEKTQEIQTAYDIILKHRSGT